MKTKYSHCHTLVLSVALALLAPATFGDGHRTGQWRGVWQDPDGGLMSIHQDGRYLTLTGKDESSAYSAHCLTDKSFTSAKCLGNGVQVNSGKRFLYRTQWRLLARKISEHWVAEFEDELLEGDLVFKRIAFKQVNADD